MRSVEDSHSAEPDELGEPLAHDLIFQNSAARSPIRRFLIPIDALDDADIEVAASAGAWGAFFHQGQIWLTAGRHLVHERIADAYAEVLVRKVKALVVAETIAKGAKVLTGGSRKGLFFEPTVITGSDPLHILAPYFLATPIVKLGPSALSVISHMLSSFERCRFQLIRRPIHFWPDFFSISS
jgi:Aldehyde dehydrogenase family